jgi:hypothetical protein
MALYQSTLYASTQSVFNTPREELQSPIQYDRTYLLDALNQGRMVISVSPLLGCDYVFVKHSTDETLLDIENIQRTLNDTLRLLPVTPKQTIFISVTDGDDLSYQFVRYDFVWINQNAESITKIDITQKEQADFMEMIYNCSSPV